MKKALLLFTLALSLPIFSQSITVNTTTHTTHQLVNDVLVNSPCVNVRNVTSRTGTNFGSTNGIGYFENTNPNFPLQNGVLLTTGNVLNAPGPNNSNLSDGSMAWLGDDNPTEPNLEATLLAAGIPMNSVNATVLEFDFTALSPTFNFQFVFASEEYGAYQCQFQDAFAFLLTDTTTNTTTNIAVIPGTSTPISVQTIRNIIYNSDCPSANAQYFGRYNGGSQAASSATDFNGQTVVINATSALVPNRTYHIKLVIADREDNEFDSAIFLGGSSFDFGENVLGQDLTMANNNALCNNNGVNEPYTIQSGLDPAQFDFIWKDENGVPIPGETNPDLTVNQPGTYQLTYYIQSSSCEVATNEIIIEYYQPISTPNPVNLVNCNSGQSSYTFNLALNTPIVDPANAYQVSYHELQSEAIANTNALPLNYSVPTGNLPKIIWVRIQNGTTSCYTTNSFQLEITPPPTAQTPWDYRVCESATGSGTGSFNLLSQNNTALNGASAASFTVSYYTNASDAASGINSIDTSVPYVSANTVIFVKIQNNTDSNCAVITNFNLVVMPNPVLQDFDDQYVCTSYTLEHLTLGNYFTGPNGTGTPLFEGEVITTEQHIYVYYQTPTTPSCNSETDFNVWIIVPADLEPDNVNFCDTYLLPPPLIPDSLYFTQTGGPTTPGNIELPIGYSTSDGETIHVYFVSDETPACIVETSFTVNIDITPTITGTFPNLFDCSQINSLPALSVGNYYTLDLGGNYVPLTFPITTTTDIYVYAENNLCRTPIIQFTAYIGSVPLPAQDACESFELVAPPVGEYRDAPNGGGNIIPPGTITPATTPSTMTIHFYVPSATCTVDDFFVINFNKPFISDQTDYTNCGAYLLPTNPDGADYYTLAGGPTTVNNVQLMPNVDSITTTSTIWLYKEAATPAGCFTEKPWNITINTKPIIDESADQVVCYRYTLLQLTNGNYFDDPLGVNPITDPVIDFTDLNANDDIPNRIKTIYIYAVNPNDSSCYTQSSFTISIDGIEAQDLGTITACDTYTLPVIAGNHYYTLSGGPNTPGNTELITEPQRTFTVSTTSPIYIYRETSNHLNCTDENLINIIINNSTTAFQPNPFEACDTFEANDGKFQFDLRQCETEVLDTQTPPSDYSFTYYTSLIDANDPNATPIAIPERYENDNPDNDSVWVRISNNNNIPVNMCFDVVELPLIVKKLPDPVLLAEYFICNDYETGTLLNPVLLNPNIPSANHTFEWRLEPSTNIISTNPTYSATVAGNYKVKVTNTLTQCFNEVSTKVTQYAPYIEVVYSDAFEFPSYITVNVLGAGSGNYEYQLDDMAFQNSNVFNNVSPGEHTITVRDKSGYCSPAPVTATIINYPKFFTPNGDGYHDTWNIVNLRNTNPNAPIFIFDRFGKLIKQIMPSTNGWDGTFNGKPLPATDYWFTVDYTEKGGEKTFKAHFSLKR